MFGEFLDHADIVSYLREWDMPGPFDETLNTGFLAYACKSAEGKVFRRLCEAACIVEGTGTHPVTQTDHDLILLKDLQQVGEFGEEWIFFSAPVHADKMECPSAADNPHKARIGLQGIERLAVHPRNAGS
jgi:hypothetical protein